MGVFTASDIVEFAIRIEENGANFYRFAVQIAKDEGTKNLFEQLANAELNHKKTFEKIFAAMDKAAPPEGYAGEYAAYLHNYVDNAIIFKKEALDQELARLRIRIRRLISPFGARWIPFCTITKSRDSSPSMNMPRSIKSSRKNADMWPCCRP
jgi:hypothetical protein